MCELSPVVIEPNNKIPNNYFHTAFYKYFLHPDIFCESTPGQNLKTVYLFQILCY